MGLVILFFHCEDREWDNPFGEELDADKWAVDSLAVSQNKINEAILIWDAVDYNIEGYKIWRNYTDSGEQVDTCIAILDNSQTSFTDENLIPDTLKNYVYSIYAFAGDNQSLVKMDSIVPSFPGPTNFSYAILDKSIASVQLNWEDNSQGEHGFVIDRRYDTNNWLLLKKTNANKVDITDQIPNNLRLYYRIRAYWTNNDKTYYSEPTFQNIAAYNHKCATFGGSKDDVLNSVCITNNSNYITVGRTNSTDIYGINQEYIKNFGGTDGLIAIIDHNLNIIKLESIGSEENETLNKIICVNDGYLIIGNTGHPDYYGNNPDDKYTNNWIVKLNHDLKIIWSKTIGATSDETIRDMIFSKSGKVYLCGKKKNSDDNFDGWLIEMDPDNGNFLNDFTIGGDNNDEFIMLNISEKNEIIITGGIESDSVYFEGIQNYHKPNNDHRDLEGRDAWVFGVNENLDSVTCNYAWGNGWHEYAFNSILRPWSDTDSSGEQLVVHVITADPSFYSEEGLYMLMCENISYPNWDYRYPLGWSRWRSYTSEELAISQHLWHDELYNVTLLDGKGEENIFISGFTSFRDLGSTYYSFVFDFSTIRMNYSIKINNITADILPDNYYAQIINSTIKTFEDGYLSVGCVGRGPNTMFSPKDWRECWIIELDHKGNIVQ